ncbi:hydroxyacylglutathione hydrolase [Arthrobacter sp. MP_M7]|nr:hydroxyacylglutathione hydrolase [Arthrobacter sp. MP_M4]MEC5202130.1 hydroxyacylglutathione hydrolase [Arthrobacter sp. MP_M7]
MVCAVTALDLNVRWYAGVRPGRRNEAPPIQVHHAATNTVLLRQNITNNFEAPFLYLLFGDERALLLDTGATGDPARFPLRETVDMLMAGWLRGHPREAYELVVAHSHAHGDHVAADGQFSGRPDTLVVGHSTEEVAAFFRLDWPRGTARFDLGGRVLEVIPTPGHHPSAVAFYDRDTGILLTGDTVYPGRLYVQDFPVFERSLQVLCDFAAARPVTAVLGAHIEMPSRPFRDFPLGSTFHPDESPLPMTAGDLKAIRDAAARVAGRPGAHRFANFIIWNGACRRESVAQSLRLLLNRVYTRVYAPELNPGSGSSGSRRAERP